MHPILLHVGSVTVYSFGLFLALGIVFGGTVVALLARKFKLSTRGLFDNLLFIIFFGVIGARIAYAIVYPQYFQAPLGSWWDVLALWQGGLLYYGAIIVGSLSAWLIFRSDQRNLTRWMDIMLIGMLIGVAFGQSGCQLGGCSAGIQSGSHWTIGGRIPVPLYEAIWATLLFITSITLYLKDIFWRRDGRTFFVFGLVYLTGRFILDFWRSKALVWHGASWMTLSDLFLIAVMAMVMAVLLIRRRSLNNVEADY